MLPDRVSNPGPLTYESGALPIALRGPAKDNCQKKTMVSLFRGRKGWLFGGVGCGGIGVWGWQQIYTIRLDYKHNAT